MSDAEHAEVAETHSRPEPSGEAGQNAGTSYPADKAQEPTAPTDGQVRSQEDTSVPDARDDSEAETVVLPGKENVSSGPHGKVIKHEGNDESRPTAVESEIGPRTGKVSSKNLSDGQEKKAKDLTATSSNLSSVKSSPAPETAPSPTASDSGFARPSSNFEDDARPKGLLFRKRKNTYDDQEEKGHKRRQRRDASLDSTTNTTASDRDRREKREVSNARSDSPQPRTRARAHSIKSNQNLGQKRKKPPPLQVGSRTRASVDAEEGSEDSDRRSGPQRIRKLASTEASAMSPAKPPHKKLKDKSGRTWLARACDSEDVEAVKARLAERPEDLNVEDYAGNTPLQIAALAGSDDIVKILLDADCDIHCKNVDRDTPLIDAVENGHLEVIKLLINAGMDPGQSNARGEELLDLLDSEGDNYHEIREVLIKAREQRRRSSEDHSRTSVPARSPRESTHPSPPPLSISGSRRQRSRRDPTRNDLLYVNATPENLREKAKIGDDEAVDHILNMRPIADLPAVLAAARGGHEMSLQLLIAIGKPEADPDPVAGTNKGQSTPMLAAVGRGNLRVIQLLLDQPGFNPTRRLFNNLTYYEIAKERRGINWEDEYRLLKKAFDRYKGRNPNGTSPNSKRDSQAHRDLKKSKSESSATTITLSKRPSPELTKDGLVRKRSGLEVKRTIERREKGRDGERMSEASRKHLRVPSKTTSREQSTAISDREVSPLAVPKEKEKKHKRSLSEAEGQEQEIPKPLRKRLISGRALRDDEEKRRRASLVSVASSSSQEPAKQKESPNGQARRVKKEESRDSSTLRDPEQAKKRPRRSVSPSDGKSPALRKSPDLEKAKRQRDPEGKASKKRDSSSESGRRDSPQPAERSSSGKSAAPVAFMGGPAPESKESKTKLPDSSKPSPKLNSRKHSPHLSPKSAPNKEIKRERENADKEQSEMSKQLQDEVQAAAEQDERKQKAKDMKEQEQKANDLKEREEQERELKEKEEREREAAEQREKERLAREEAAAREEVERQAKEEAARVEAQRIAKEEAEREARLEREAEEARQEQKRQEEEQARRLAERERQRKEEEERQVRRRAEQEERERIARIRKREEDERRRREALPNALKILAELSPEQARQESEVKHWLPLYTAKGSQLEAHSDPAANDELWISNVQVAPLLGITDLELSQYTAWTKRAATKPERASLWRVLRRRLTRYEPPMFGPVDHSLEFRMDRETHDKYDSLNRVFWIRLSDLQDIIPRYPHLATVDLKCTAIGLAPLRDSHDGHWTNGSHRPLVNGNLPNGTLTNGYH